MFLMYYCCYKFKMKNNDIYNINEIIELRKYLNVLKIENNL